ncbi:enoyl-CoA hydratase [Nocardioides sp. LHG3406-4]|uniref:enoyl-CoA hydratase n=1 Tax=Nocardioides sp. LHG3406-4 TaxID=2804575 RepID=UPI003CF80D2D
MPDLDRLLEDGVLWLVLNRPEVGNAMDGTLSDHLAVELEDAQLDETVRTVVVTGSGTSFCSGADISGSDAHERFDVTALDRANRIIRALTHLDKPVIAAVNGVAAGVGASIAFAADLAVATESARFVLAFARIGLMPDGGSSATIAAAAGRSRAMRMALLGDPLSATEAYAAGLVSHVVPDAEFGDLVIDVARRVATGPPLAFAATKKAINAATLGHLEAALERERTGQSILLRTDDAAEGMAAFAEKRRPNFHGL